MKLKLDENLGELGRALLMTEGHDMSTVAMQGMSGSHDVALYEACRAEGRVLVSLDRDFGEVLRFPQRTAPASRSSTAAADFPRAPSLPGSRSLLSSCEPKRSMGNSGSPSRAG